VVLNVRFIFMGTGKRWESQESAPSGFLQKIHIYQNLRRKICTKFGYQKLKVFFKRKSMLHPEY
jgi:hypothetical protein